MDITANSNTKMIDADHSLNITLTDRIDCALTFGANYFLDDVDSYLEEVQDEKYRTADSYKPLSQFFKSSNWEFRILYQ